MFMCCPCHEPGMHRGAAAWCWDMLGHVGTFQDMGTGQTPPQGSAGAQPGVSAPLAHLGTAGLWFIFSQTLSAPTTFSLLPSWVIPPAWHHMRFLNLFINICPLLNPKQAQGHLQHCSTAPKLIQQGTLKKRN